MWAYVHFIKSSLRQCLDFKRTCYLKFDASFLKWWWKNKENGRKRLRLQCDKATTKWSGQIARPHRGLNTHQYNAAITQNIIRCNTQYTYWVQYSSRETVNWEIWIEPPWSKNPSVLVHNGQNGDYQGKVASIFLGKRWLFYELFSFLICSQSARPGPAGTTQQELKLWWK